MPGRRELALTRPFDRLRATLSQWERANAHKSFSLWEKVALSEAKGRMRARTNAGSLAAKGGSG